MRDHYSDHLSLLEVWNNDLNEMKKGKARKGGKKPKPKISVDVLSHGSPDELRVVDKEGNERYIDDIMGNDVVLSDPFGNRQVMSKTSVSSTQRLG